MICTRPLLQLAFAALCSLTSLAGLAASPEKITSIEGVTEYRLSNGLRVLLVPDNSIDTVIVHITYLVGSRHEGYGEKGMAHLLEHMLFKGTARHPNVKEEFARRGARFNGTTSYDRTNYFETLSATPENLDWALGVEADRMINAHVRKEDLDSEMTVVRNEFESGENSPGNVLRQRMAQLAFPWHNYGRSVIGARSDIENVPIERLRGFYRTYYQPDNAVLAVGGKFDEQSVLSLIAKHFGALPRPARKLPELYTVEPTQDGERSVVLRRAGDTQLVAALYRAPSGRHADYPSIDVLVHVLSAPATGRLHRALVQTGLASSMWGAESALHDPGFMIFGAGLSKTATLEAPRDALLATIENLAREPVSAQEVERAKTALLNAFEKFQIDSRALVGVLSEFSATGDWRLFYLYRDRLRNVTPEDVRRVASAYLKPANRVLGTFIATEQPARAEIPQPEDLTKALAGYTGGQPPELGDAFDPSPENIEARVIRKTLANGIRVALLAKKTRGGNVIATLTLHSGDEESKMNRGTACSLAGGMLMRGSQKYSRAQLRDAFEKLNASVSVSGDGAGIDVRRAQFGDTLRLVAEVLRSPAFPADEFRELKQASITRTESQRSDPGAIAGERIARYLAPYPRGHWLHVLSMDERIAELERTNLADAQRCYADLIGASAAEFAAVGDFDPETVMKLLEELFGDWKSPAAYKRIPARYFERPRWEDEVRTPDKANAVLRAGINLKLRDDNADFAALILGNYLLGGSSTARLPGRIREKEGLSYSTYSSFTASQLDETASFSVSAIFAPQNKPRVETAIREEIDRVLREGFSDEEVAAGKTGVLQARRLARTQDRSLVGRLSMYLYVNRSFAWDLEFENKIAALTKEEIRDAMRRHLDASKLSVMKAGDFKN
ncbi:MAG: insulinase family protein [Betaproteobacteria bacterium]|nr:insulinase family protein [Betaproteobacteria bacterium]